MNDDFVINIEPPLHNNLNDVNLENKLLKWRDNMRDEINCLLFLQFKINNEKNDFDNNIKEKYFMILTKLEDLCTKEIDLINEGLINIKGSDKEGNSKIINNVLFEQVEYIRNKYNTLIEGINNTIKSSNDLLSFYREYYKKNNNKNDSIIDNKLISFSKIEPQVSPRENEKNSDDLLSEIRNDISDIVSDNYFNSNFSKISSTNLLSNLTSIQNDSPKKLLSKFKNLLKLTRYRPKKKYKNDLTEIMSNKDIDIENVAEYEEKNLAYQKLSLDIREVNKFINSLKDQIYFNCIMDDEKKTFEKMKDDNIKLNDELNKLKDNLKILDVNYKFLLKKLSEAEEEQIYLQNENKKLIDYIQQRYMKRDFNQIQQNNVNKNFLFPQNSSQKILTSLGTTNKSSYEMYNNIERNIEKNNFYKLKKTKQFFLELIKKTKNIILNYYLK